MHTSARGTVATVPLLEGDDAKIACCRKVLLTADQNRGTGNERKCVIILVVFTPILEVYWLSLIGLVFWDARGHPCSRDAAFYVKRL